MNCTNGSTKIRGRYTTGVVATACGERGEQFWNQIQTFPICQILIEDIQRGLRNTFLLNQLRFFVAIG